jgi:hypothetical protein
MMPDTLPHYRGKAASRAHPDISPINEESPENENISSINEIFLTSENISFIVEVCLEGKFI